MYLNSDQRKHTREKNYKNLLVLYMMLIHLFVVVVIADFVSGMWMCLFNLQRFLKIKDYLRCDHFRCVLCLREEKLFNTWKNWPSQKAGSIIQNAVY